MSDSEEKLALSACQEKVQNLRRGPPVATFDGIARQTLLEVPVPAITILLHPDLGRVGERALLSDLSSGFPVSISRYGPLFMPKDKSQSRALLDARVSRRPLWISREHDELILTAESRARIRVGSQKLKRSRRIPLGQLATDGVMISMGSGVLLWLHMAVGSQPVLNWRRLLGVSQKARRLRTRIQELSKQDQMVLIRGGEGCEPERVARAIHSASNRTDGPFIKQLVGKLPQRGVVEEIFGSPHTGGLPGAIREANGGTLFLYDIGHASPEVQNRLELFLSGEDRGSATDIRILVGSRMPLERLVAEGRFSYPLLCRLQALELTIPSLQSRRVDIPIHAYHYLKESLESIERSHLLDEPVAPTRPWLVSGLILKLMEYDYPRNQEELREVVEQVVGHSHSLESASLPPNLAHKMSKDSFLKRVRPVQPPRRAAIETGSPTAVFDPRKTIKITNS